MPPKGPSSPTPIPKPKNYHDVTCPHCGKVNRVTDYEILKGFKCSGCGQKVDGIIPPAPGPDDPWIIEEDK